MSLFLRSRSLVNLTIISFASIISIRATALVFREIIDRRRGGGAAAALEVAAAATVA